MIATLVCNGAELTTLTVKRLSSLNLIAMFLFRGMILSS